MYKYIYLQTLVAIREVTKQIIRKPDERSISPLDFDRFLVLSLGTGSNMSEHKYNAKMVSKWGILTWLFNSGSTPIIDCFSEASIDMVDYHNVVVFSALQSQDNYLRIQVSYLCVWFALKLKTLQIKIDQIYT